MELLLKRNEKPGTFGTRYDLFAKLELKPEELARIRKAKPDKTYIWMPEGKEAFKEGRSSRIKGLLLAIFAGVVAMIVAGGNPMWFWIVALVSFFPLSKLAFNQTRKGITVSDIITGRTIQCKSIDELYEKENTIKEKIQNYCQYMEGMGSLGNEQRIDLSRG
jgi:hypothetical protein